jgi:hypothetical protein
MIVVLPEGTRSSPMEIVGRARVATVALKICVFAYADVERSTVRYAAFKRIGQGGAVFASPSAALRLLPGAAAAEMPAVGGSLRVDADSTANSHSLPEAPSAYLEQSEISALPKPLMSECP